MPELEDQETDDTPILEEDVTEEGAASPNGNSAFDEDALANRIMSQIERKIHNITGNQLQRIERMIEDRLSRTDGKKSPLNADEQTLLDQAIEASPALQNMLRQQKEQVEIASSQASVQEYRRRWTKNIEDTRSVAGKHFSEADYNKVVRLLDRGLEEDAQEVLDGAKKRAKQETVKREEARRKAGTGSGGHTGTNRIAYKPGSNATDRHKRAAEIARKSGR